MSSGRVAPNPWYGFRVHRTLEDPRLWFAVNKYSGLCLLVVGVAEIAVATALYFVPGLEWPSTLQSLAPSRFSDYFSKPKLSETNGTKGNAPRKLANIVTDADNKKITEIRLSQFGG